jgi:hypothetical protein
MKWHINSSSDPLEAKDSRGSDFCFMQQGSQNLTRIFDFNIG